jgi:membrane-bound serine protease (ClpP class)
MEPYVIVALVAAALLLAEAVLPTGGILGAIGVAGFFTAGVIGLAIGGTTADVFGGALVALAIVSAVVLWFVARKVYAAHRGQPPWAGTEEMVGGVARARSSITVEGGQAFMRGTLWSARLAADAAEVAGAAPIKPGDMVTVEAVDGLTLVVRPQPQPARTGKASEGSG